jgi:hypothetical protein
MSGHCDVNTQNLEGIVREYHARNKLYPHTRQLLLTQPLNATIMQTCKATITQQSRNLTTQQSRKLATQQSRKLATQHQNFNVVVDLLFLQNPSKQRCRAIFLLNLFTFRNLTENFQLTYACQVSVIQMLKILKA